MPFSAGAFGNIGGGVSDLFAASGDRAKAQGDYFEAANYDLAARYAQQEAEYTKESTAIQVMRRMRAMLEELHDEVRPEHRAAVHEELARLDVNAHR